MSMRISNMSRRLLASAPLLFALAGCDGNQVTDPAPAATAVSPAYGYGWGKGTTIRLVHDAEAPLLEISNWALIGPAGGQLRLGLHELVVPPRVVANPTRFVFTMQYGPHFIIELTAVDQVTGLPVTQFRNPLQLKLSYWMLPVPRGQVHRLILVWLKDDDVNGELVPVKTTTQPGSHYVVGWLTHFTKFAMGMN
jgi:hypothetical protein